MAKALPHLLRQWRMADGRGTRRWVSISADLGVTACAAPETPLPPPLALQPNCPRLPLPPARVARTFHTWSGPAHRAPPWAWAPRRATHAPSGVMAAEIVGGGGRRSAVHEHGWKFAVVGAAGLLFHRHHTKQRDARALLQARTDMMTPQGLESSKLAPPPDVVHPFVHRNLAVRVFVLVRRVLRLVFVFAPFVAASSLLPVLSGRPDFMKWYLALMVRTLEDAGASFQKLGQWLSMRPDLFDASVIEALSSLRDDGPRHPFSYTRELLEHAFGCPLEMVFEHLEVEPVASGSVAQVHRGRLRESFVQECIATRNLDHDMSFRDVAVKVRHPDVLESSWIDGELIFGAVTVLAKATGMGFTMPFDKDGFCRAMQRQIDFNWEAYNLKQFHSNFSDDSLIEFPRVVAVHDAVLVESWFPGKSVANLFERFTLSHDAQKAPSTTPAALVRRRSSSGSEVEAEPLAKISDTKRKKLAAAIFDMTIKMYLRDNYIHGDLHGGNLLYSTDPSDNRVFVLDAGLTTALERDWASPFGYLLHALTLGNGQRVAEKLLQFNISPTPVDRAAFASEVEQVMSMYTKEPEGRGPVNMGAMMGHVLMVLQKHKVSLRSDVAMTIVTMSISEGLIRQLDPDFDIVRNAVPYFVRFRSWGTSSLSGKAWETEAQGANGGLPADGNRGVAVTTCSTAPPAFAVPTAKASAAPPHSLPLASPFPSPVLGHAA